MNTMKRISIAPGSNGSDAALASLAALIGLLVRLLPALRDSFPLNDGGLFYQMILDLQASHFRLPSYTTYNFAHIPFAYPPLGLYVAGLLSSALHADVLAILRLLPPIISALCVPAFYFLARRILKGSQGVALAAALAFALMPRAFEWQIMGGGITRSFGMLFALLTWRAAYDLFTEKSPRYLLSTSVWASLTILSHPEAAAQAAFGALLLYLVLDRSRKGAIYALTVAAAAAILISPWWATVLAQHGVAPFLAAIEAAREGTTVDFPAGLFLAFQFSFSQEFYLPLISVVGLIGLFAELSRRRLLLPLWVIAPLFFEPRSAPQFIAVPLAMLAGIGLSEVIVPGIRNVAAASPHPTLKATDWLLAYLALYLLLSAYLTASAIATNITLHEPDVAAFRWIRENTPVDSRFALITQQHALADPWVEWFPALAQRVSLDTVFGSEWLRAISFGRKIAQYNGLQACVDEDETCLQAWSRNSGLEFTHILIRRNGKPSVLLESLSSSPGYRLIYDTQNFAVFQNQQ